jgi:hypothetical protein
MEINQKADSSYQSHFTATILKGVKPSKAPAQRVVDKYQIIQSSSREINHESI